MDLNKAKPGDELLTKHGTILTYVGLIPGDYPHEIRYPDGARGIRCDNGNVMHNNTWDTDEDVVEILG